MAYLNWTWDPSRLKTLIKQTGISEAAFIRATGIPESSFHIWLTNRQKPSVAALIAMADLFAVPLDYLVGRCDEETAKAVLENYSEKFMELRRAPYEWYLLHTNKTGSVSGSDDYEAPWPYNLADLILGEPVDSVLTEDQLDGLMAALATLTEREQAVLLRRMHEGLSLDQVAGESGVTRERIRQIEAKAVRKLRHPSRRNLVLYGRQGVFLRAENAKRLASLVDEKERLDVLEKALEQKKEQLSIMTGYEEPEQADPFIPSMALIEMDLSVRSYNCLYRAGCRNLDDVVRLAKAGELPRVRNLGKKSAEEILAKIQVLTGFDLAVQNESEGSV